MISLYFKFIFLTIESKLRVCCKDHVVLFFLIVTKIKFRLLKKRRNCLQFKLHHNVLKLASYRCTCIALGISFIRIPYLELSPERASKLSANFADPNFLLTQNRKVLNALWNLRLHWKYIKIAFSLFDFFFGIE